MAKELSREFPYSRKKVWDALPSALSSAKMSVDEIDAGSGTIEASTGVSLRSWGEKVEIRVSEIGAGPTTVTVRSGLKFGLAGWGKLKKNIERVFEALDSSLR
jgi:hypothetical protein